MEKFTILSSKVMPIALKDVDTDLILPAQFLTSISKDGYGENLFRRLRDTDPNFPLNLSRYQGAQILVADENFGCGSSREHAVWALTGYGIRAVVGKSFADIFYNNSAKNGLLLVKLEEKLIDRMLEEAKSGEYRLTLDLETQTVTLPDGEKCPFDFDPFRRHCLLNGLDDIDYIMSHEDEIKRFRARQEPTRFFSTLA